MNTNQLKILVFMAIFLVSCIERDRTNPFDPEADSNRGDIYSLSVTSDLNSVFLNWTVPDISNLQGVIIFRKLDGLTFISLDTLPLTEMDYVDIIR
jgi:hypothetical protein